MSTLPNMDEVGRDIQARLTAAEAAQRSLESAVSQLNTALDAVKAEVEQIKTDYQKVADMPVTADFHD